MTKSFIKVLTLAVIFGSTFYPAESYAAVLKQEVAKTHLRWNVFTPKNNLIIDKRGNRVLLRTLNSKLYETLKSEFSRVSSMPRYISKVKFLGPNKKTNVSTIEVQLADQNVEMFNFYRDRDQKHVFDFWKEGEDEKALKEQKAALKVVKKSEKKKEIPPVLKRPVVKKKEAVKKAPVLKKAIVRNPNYRDYRYGASFVWDYSSLGPGLPSTFDIRTKTPEHFYPITNRNYSKDDKEAHLQLAINLYRKKKYGLMYKSLKLFREKYGADTEVNFIEYLKANAILRDNIAGGNLEPLKMAINMLSSIGSRTKNYDLQKAIYKYLLVYYQQNGDFVEGLTVAKRLYVSSKENFDYEESSYAAESILYNLAGLNQVEKIGEVMKEKTIRKIIQRSKLIAYEMFVHHKMGNMKKVLAIYEANKAGLAKPIAPSILFNIAETYFRQAQYEKAINLFDEFITQHSYHSRSSHARLRIALAFEILNKDIKETIVLYKNAINRSQDKLISAEARIRYAALRSVRAKRLDESALENRVFLDIDENIKLSQDVKKLLWLVRLRAFIVDKEYEKGMAYLAALPLSSLKKVERRVFEADGAEIVYGILLRDFQQSEYSKVVKTWNRFKDRYVRKVANDAFMNFIVGQSYLKLGLYEGFDDVYASFKKLAKTPNRTFPLWVKRQSTEDPETMLLELDVVKNIHLKNWNLVRRGANAIAKRAPKSNQPHYYRALAHYAKKDYKEASKDFERYLSSQKRQTIFDPMELAGMINKYTDSLYQQGEFEKFQNVTDAILADTRNYAPENPFMKSMRERLEYLSIEILAGKGTPKSWLLLEPKAKKFLENYKTTDYRGRLNYLLGMSLAKNNKPQEAKGLFEKILQDQDVPGSIKELVRSELSLMAIKERTI